ncbi:hypothetical protein JVU11DRAFT_10008 [Chiua virens]|nr:hypothetical protein JVU11DRAFT_10008 [Chiua virens]
MKLREAAVNSDVLLNGDPVKFAEATYKVACLEDPPRRMPLHPLCMGILRERGKHLVETADKWESWSEDLLIKD